MAVRLIEQAGVLDLERCPFARVSPAGSSEDQGRTPARCWADGRPIPVPAGTYTARCSTPAHTACPALLERLGGPDAEVWLAAARAARVVAESCRLTQARLEVYAEQLGPALEHLFGGEP